MKVIFCAQSRLTFYCAALLISLQLIGSWLFGLYSLAGDNVDGVSVSEKFAQLKCIKARLASGEPNLLSYTDFPDGKIFCWSFYGFDLVNIALPPDCNPALKRSIQSELAHIISVVEEMYKEQPYCRFTNLHPRGGVILAGQANLLRAGYLLVGGDNHDIVRAFHEQSKYLFDQFMSTKTGCLESYPDVIWPCDNCCALASLSLHDKLFGTSYGAACRKWVDFMRAHLDKRSGMMVAQFDSQGNTLDGPRGNALSWSLAFMPVYAPELSQQQYSLYRNNWYQPVLGMVAVREWLPGSKRKIDVYSGLVVADIGAAASGLGIAACRANGDFECWRGELRGLEAIGLPQWTLNGEKTYFLRKMLLADVLSLWGKTIRNWATDNAADVKKMQFVRKLDRNYWLVLAIAAVISAAILSGIVRQLADRILEYRKTEQRWTRQIVVLLILQLFLLADLVWIGEINLLAIMALIALIEDMCVRPYYVRKAFEKSS